MHKTDLIWGGTANFFGGMCLPRPLLATPLASNNRLLRYFNNNRLLPNRHDIWYCECVISDSANAVFSEFWAEWQLASLAANFITSRGSKSNLACIISLVAHGVITETICVLNSFLCTNLNIKLGFKKKLFNLKIVCGLRSYCHFNV